jgi:hypothetical protein
MHRRASEKSQLHRWIRPIEEPTPPPDLRRALPVMSIPHDHPYFSSLLGF